MEIDGKKQRNALTAAERALLALGKGDGPRARKSAAKAAELDQVGLYTELPSAVDAAADDLDASSSVSAESWKGLSTVVGPGPLQALIPE